MPALFTNTSAAPHSLEICLATCCTNDSDDTFPADSIDAEAFGAQARQLAINGLNVDQNDPEGAFAPTSKQLPSRGPGLLRSPPRFHLGCQMGSTGPIGRFAPGELFRQRRARAAHIFREILHFGQAVFDVFCRHAPGLRFKPAVHVNYQRRCYTSRTACPK